LDTLSKEVIASIVSSVKGKVWILAYDHNGNHVIQKSITKMNAFLHEAKGLKQAQHDDQLEPKAGKECCDTTHAMLVKSLDIIVDEVTASIKDLAIHPYGCRVVQRLIEHSVDTHRTKVLDCISNQGLSGPLINHEYGNYVVQRMLAYGRGVDKETIFETIIASDIWKLSKMKYSSNVVETMLTHGSAEQRHKIIEEMLSVSTSLWFLL